MAGPIEIRGSKNLGLIKAIHVGVNPPLNKRILWFDDNTGIKIHKYYNFEQSLWLPLGGNGDITINGHYVYIAFASDCDGADFAFVFDEMIHTHTSIISSNTAIAPIDLTLDKFEKKFIRFCGEGVLGNYVYVAFADDDQGTNFSLSPTYEIDCGTCSFVESYVPLNINPGAGRDYLLNPTSDGFNLDLNIQTPNTLEIELSIDGNPLDSNVDYSIEVQVPPTFPSKFFVRLDEAEVGGYYVEGNGLAQTLKFLKTNQSSKLFLEFFEDGVNVVDELFIRIGAASCIDPETEGEVCTKTRSCFAIINSDVKIEDIDITVDKFEGKWFCTCCDTNPAFDLQNIKNLINSLIQQQIDIRNEMLSEITNLLNLIENLQTQITDNYNSLELMINNNQTTIIGYINDINSQIIDIISTLELNQSDITLILEQLSDEVFNPRVIELINTYGGIISGEEKMKLMLDTTDLGLKWKRGDRFYTKLQEEITAGVQDGFYVRNGFISNQDPSITLSDTLDYSGTTLWEVREINNLVLDIDKNRFQNFSKYEPKLIITRYSPTKNKYKENLDFTGNIDPGNGQSHFSHSGYKQDKRNLKFKPSSLKINKGYQVLDIGQEHYFRQKYDNTSGILFGRFYARGLGNKSETRYRKNALNYTGTSQAGPGIFVKKANIYLEFHLEVNYLGTIIRSKPLGRLKMFLTIEDNFEQYPDITDPGYVCYQNTIKFKHV